MIKASLKKRFYILAGLMWLALQQLIGQPVPSIELTFNKTTTVVFAAAIASVDRGSRDVLVQKAKAMNNVLQLKAAKVNFEETNLTVITTDGFVHHYFVRYSRHPSGYTVIADGLKESGRSVVQFSEGTTTSTLEASAQKILGLNAKGSIKTIKRFGMQMSIEGIYAQDNIMFYHLRIANASNIPFLTDVLEFSVSDRQKVKRTAFQQVIKRPVFQSANCDRIEGKTATDLILAFPAFTMPDAKVLRIGLLEKDGGRHLSLRLKNKTILSASQL
ncbi:MAG TPA: conjugative transposon protein TraN [Chryseolinea sp.]